MAYTKYSLTPADNNAAPPNGAPEGMLPSGVNDTMRDMMSQIRDVGDGIRDGTYTMTAPKITGGSITGVTFSSIVVTGGSINNATIGATTPSTGAFSTLSATGATTFSGATVISGSLTANTFSSSNATITGGAVSGITDLAVADGGTGASSITANSVILGNGSSTLSGNLVAPGSSGNVLTSNGTTWVSQSSTNAYVGPQVQAFTSSGTFTVPTGITAVKVSVIGGGGGGASFTVAGGGGGNSSFGSSVICGGGTGGGTPTGSGDECGTTNPNNGGTSTNVPYELTMLRLKGTYGTAGGGSTSSNPQGCFSGGGENTTQSSKAGVGYVTGLTSGASISVTVGAGGTSSGGNGSTAGTAGVVIVEW